MVNRMAARMVEDEGDKTLCLRASIHNLLYMGSWLGESIHECVL